MGVYKKVNSALVLYERVRADASPQISYIFVDGRRGALGDPNAEVSCENGELSSIDGLPYEVVALGEQDTRFASEDITLAGRLITPARWAERSEVGALAVFVHGSEATPTVGASPYPYLFAAQGVTVFAYDKRGTGRSGGEYTQDFHVLAGDAAAAMKEAKRLAANDADRFGYFGGSQGGWVAPLAATKTDADFLLVGFGLVLSPVEEDAEQVYDEMRRRGYGPEDIEKAKDITAATGEIVASQFASGIDLLQAAKHKHRNEPWLNEIEGEFTGAVLQASEEELRGGVAGDFEDSNVRWRHDPIAVLRSLDLPQLWVIAANDTVAPGHLTQTRLEMLQTEGYPITTALFPDTDHGMLEFIEGTDGTRKYTRITEGYLRLISDYAKGQSNPPYGAAMINPPAVAN